MSYYPYYQTENSDYSSFNSLMADICEPSPSSSSSRKRPADSENGNSAKMPVVIPMQPVQNFTMQYPIDNGWQNFNMIHQVYNNNNMNQPGYGWVGQPPPMPQDFYKARPGQTVTPPMNEFHNAHGTQQTPNDNSGNLPISSVMYTPESDLSTTSANFTPDWNTTTNGPCNQEKRNKENLFPNDDTSSGKLFDYFLTNTERENESENNIPHPYNKAVFPTFGVPVSSDGNVVAEVVDGRLPAVGTRSKYDLTVDELRRRCGAPEHMNQSALYCFFRKSKKKEAINRVKKVLTDYNITVRTMQRQRKVTCFSPFLEEEATALARDLDSITEEFLPIDAIALEMLEKLIFNNKNLDICLRILKNTNKTITRVIKTLEVRQPKITGQKEKLKGNSLDLSYHNFSLTTHGFGHPNSLSHYRSYQKIVEQAALYCEKMQKGASLPSKEYLIPGQKPFENMSNEFFVEWRMRSYHKKARKEMLDFNQAYSRSS